MREKKLRHKLTLWALCEAGSGLAVFSVPNAELPVMPSNGGKCLCSAGFMQRYSALLEGGEEGDDRSIGSESRRYPARQQKIL